MNGVRRTRGNGGLDFLLNCDEQRLIRWYEGDIGHVADGRVCETFRQVERVTECVLFGQVTVRR